MTTEIFETPKKRKLTWLFIAIPFVIIATCNYYINTHQEKAIMENPQPGDFFVFRGLLGASDQPFKLKGIKNDTMEFYIPKYGLLNFNMNKSEGKVYELDRQGKLFDSALTIKFPKSTIDSLQKNSQLSVRLESSPKVYLKAVFGRSRGNAVENALNKMEGKDSVRQ